MKRALIFAVAISCLAVGAAPVWPEPTREMKPWIYNWWMGSAVDREGLEAQSGELLEKGFGGFHIIPVYGAKGYEDKWKKLLSPEWMEAYRLAHGIAAEKGLAVDLTMGSGWCFGGPWLDKEDGVRKVGGTLTGQQVSRAGLGGQGPMMDPYSVSAMRKQLQAFEVFDAPDTPQPKRFFHDSWAYHGAGWTPDFYEAFKAKRGYDLREKQDLFEGRGDPEAVAAVKCDYRETLSDLVIEDVFPLWVEWCHQRGIQTRNEAHGAPVNWLDFYALADIPETEMFGDKRDILASKFASSAAHVTGRPLVAAESCTWLSNHFTETLSEAKVFIDRLFLSGVNHMFYHGLCYSPKDAPWPGWCFYAAAEINPRNPIWRDIDVLNSYVTRCQSVFQTCEPDADVLVYWPIRDFWWSADGYEKPMQVWNLDWLYGEEIGKTAKTLYEAGYSFDFISDRQLQSKDLKLDARYDTLVMPFSRHTPEKTHACTNRFAHVAFGRPGGEIGLRSARREPFPACGVNFTRFRKDADTVYFLVNQSGAKVCRQVRPNCALKSAWRMDPLTGEIKAVAVVDGQVVLELEKDHSAFLWCSPTEVGDAIPASNSDAVLDLGDVIGNESVRVSVNGTCVGTLILPPYRVAIPREILKGPKLEDNEITLEVAERAANRIRQMDIDKVNWKYFNDANVLSPTYKPLDASTWDVMEHGVKGPLKLTFN